MTTTFRDTVNNPIIRVNRRIPPIYPGWMMMVMHPELENVGPREYDLTKVELSLPRDDQEVGKWTNGKSIYEYLETNDGLKNCLGLHDALTIQKKRRAVSFRIFGGRPLPCWKSVVRHRDGRLFVPMLINLGRAVVVQWSEFDHEAWLANFPVALYASDVE